MPSPHPATGSRRALGSLLIAALLAFVALASGCTASDNDGASYTLVEDGKLTVASDLATPPFEYTESDGTPQGFTVELMGMIAEEMGPNSTTSRRSSSTPSSP